MVNTRKGISPFAYFVPALIFAWTLVFAADRWWVAALFLGIYWIMLLLLNHELRKKPNGR